MTEREWMSFDNEFKSLMDELSLIAGYNGLLTQMCDSASLEQLDAAMMTEHVELQVKAKTVWNSWHFVEDRSHITGKKTLSREIFLQEKWLSQFLFVPLPCHR